MGNIDHNMTLLRMAEKEQLPEVGLQYEADDARIRALYEIPLSGAPTKVLEVVMGDAPTLPRTGWASTVVVHDLLNAGEGRSSTGQPAAAAHVERCVLPFADGSVDLVVLHRTFDRIAAHRGRGARGVFASALMREIHRVLRADGVIAGCATNRLACLLRGKNPSGRALTGPAGYRGLLDQAGFRPVHLFTVLPGPDAPHNVLSLAPHAIREISRIKLHAYRDRLSWPSYALRRISTELMLDRWLADSLFFFSSKQ